MKRSRLSANTSSKRRPVPSLPARVIVSMRSQRERGRRTADAVDLLVRAAIQRAEVEVAARLVDRRVAVVGVEDAVDDEVRERKEQARHAGWALRQSCSRARRRTDVPGCSSKVSRFMSMSKTRLGSGSDEAGSGCAEDTVRA